MNYQGSLPVVEEIEKVILRWNEVRRIKDGSKGGSAAYSRVYEIYIGCYVYWITLFFDKRQDMEKGRISLPTNKQGRIFTAIHGLKELIDKLNPMTGQWERLDTIQPSFVTKSS